MIPPRLEPILTEVGPLARRFTGAGFRIFLVGGTVRDAIDARTADLQASAAVDGDPVRADPLAHVDLDLTTDALPDDIERVVRGWADAVWLQGKRFGTVGAMKDGRHYEITTHRSEVYAEASRKPEVTFGKDIITDLSRRDFTINAMALEVPGNELVDPFGGVVDLAAGVLRTPLDPSIAFSDDPLRMMRAARFIAGRGLVPDPALVTAVVEMHERLSIVSAERIRDELDKLLVLPRPEEGLWFLVRTGLAGMFMPELPALALEQDPIHRHKDVLAHTIAVVAKTRPRLTLRLAALLHDIGKPRTRSIGPDGVSFHHHDVVGARMTRNRMREMRYPTAETERVSKLVELHLRFHTYQMGWTDSAVRRYRTDAGDLLEDLNELTRCDCTTRNENRARALGRRMDELERRLAELAEQEALDAIRPQLDGVQVMKVLGLPPGRDVGAALAFLLEIRLEEGVLDEQEIVARLEKWWKDRSG